MTFRTRLFVQRSALIICAAAISIVVHQALAQEGPDWHKGLPRQYKSKWLVHDLDRPLPPRVTPGAKPGDPPSDAIVLFDGTDLSQWVGGDWKVENGYAEVRGGSIRTREKFSDCQFHVEYMAPARPAGVSQIRGNSGIFFMNRYEVQVLDNHDNKSYADGYIGAVYGQHPPIVNACRKPGEWQVYDIVFRAPRFEGEDVVEPARVTVLLNGVVVQHNAEVYGRTVWRNLATYKPHGPDSIQLQDHGDKQPVRFRNIWIRRLDLSPEALDNRS